MSKYSYVNIYYIPWLRPEKNFYCQIKSGSHSEFITVLLRQGGHTVYQSSNNFQYVRHALELDIKINASDLNLQKDTFNRLYVVIDNTETTNNVTIHDIRYYFVINQTWVSESTIKYHLKMDVLNSFRFDTNTPDYVLTNK